MKLTLKMIDRINCINLEIVLVEKVHSIATLVGLIAMNDRVYTLSTLDTAIIDVCSINLGIAL